MADHDDLARSLKEQAQAFQDIQLKNLSGRIFEAGKRADSQLTAWLTFSALAVLLIIGVADTVSIGGLRLNALVAAAVAFILSCAMYYRVSLSLAAIEVWRKALRARREERFWGLLVAAEKASVLEDAKKELASFIAEYPGYLACSVLLKDEATMSGGFAASIVKIAHYGAIALFIATPFVLAIALIVRTGFGLFYILTAVFGLIFILAGIQITQYSTRPQDEAVNAA